MALFDKSAQDYDSWFQSPVGKFVDETETDCLFSLADDIRDTKILDLGCGTGHLSEKLYHQGAIVTGIDVSNSMLQKARESSQQQNLKIDYQYMDVFKLDFPMNSFDCIFSMAALEFMGETTPVFESIKKVLKPGGSVVIGTIQKGSAWADLYKSQAFSQTVFANADFKDIDDFNHLNGFKAVASNECLFVPPGLGDDAYTADQEMQAKQEGYKGGFLCVKLIKE